MYVLSLTDRYAFGMLMWEVLTERRPFEDIRSETMLCSRVHLGYRPDVRLVVAGEGTHTLAARYTTTLSAAASSAVCISSSCISTATTASAIHSTCLSNEFPENYNSKGGTSSLSDENDKVVKELENPEDINDATISVEDLVIREVRKLITCNWSADRSQRKTGTQCCEILHKCKNQLLALQQTKVC